MMRAVFFLGRGNNAHPLGEITSDTAPGPQAIAVLPVGQWVLAATNPDDYAAGVEALLTAWTASGFGDIDYPAVDDVRDECPDPSGARPAPRPARHSTSPTPTPRTYNRSWCGATMTGTRTPTPHHQATATVLCFGSG
jgi:hypothetical protein